MGRDSPLFWFASLNNLFHLLVDRNNYFEATKSKTKWNSVQRAKMVKHLTMEISFFVFFLLKNHIAFTELVLFFIEGYFQELLFRCSESWMRKFILFVYIFCMPLQWLWFRGSRKGVQFSQIKFKTFFYIFPSHFFIIPKQLCLSLCWLVVQ